MIKKLSNKDEKDWKKFTDSDEKLEIKDLDYNKFEKNFKKKSIDLHGYTLESANKVININSHYFNVSI